MTKKIILDQNRNFSAIGYGIGFYQKSVFEATLSRWVLDLLENGLLMNFTLDRGTSVLSRNNLIGRIGSQQVYLRLIDH